MEWFCGLKVEEALGGESSGLMVGAFGEKVLIRSGSEELKCAGLSVGFAVL